MLSRRKFLAATGLGIGSVACGAVGLAKTTNLAEGSGAGHPLACPEVYGRIKVFLPLDELPFVYEIRRQKMSGFAQDALGRFPQATEIRLTICHDEDMSSVGDFHVRWVKSHIHVWATNPQDSVIPIWVLERWHVGTQKWDVVCCCREDFSRII